MIVSVLHSKNMPFIVIVYFLAFKLKTHSKTGLKLLPSSKDKGLFIRDVTVIGGSKIL